MIVLTASLVHKFSLKSELMLHHSLPKFRTFWKWCWRTYMACSLSNRTLIPLLDEGRHSPSMMRKKESISSSWSQPMNHKRQGFPLGWEAESHFYEAIKKQTVKFSHSLNIMEKIITCAVLSQTKRHHKIWQMWKRVLPTATLPLELIIKIGNCRGDPSTYPF